MRQVWIGQPWPAIGSKTIQTCGHFELCKIRRFCRCPWSRVILFKELRFFHHLWFFFGNFDLFCPSVETLYIYIYEWRSEFPVSRVVWTKKSWNWKVDFTFWLWGGPQLNDALHKLGAIASVALVKLWYAERCAINMQRVVLNTFSKIFHCGCFAAIFVFNMGDKESNAAPAEPKRWNAVGILRALAEI